MKTLNQSRIHAIKPILIAAGLAAAATVSAWATDAPLGLTADSSNTAASSVVVDPELAAQAKWRALMAQTPSPDEGCFHASYPSIVWEKEACKVAQPRVRPVHVKLTDDTEEVVGNTNDYVAEAKGLITLASGGFSTKGVKSEKSVGVAAFHDAGILGSNEYSLQLNTNAKETTSACAGHSGCTVWQQFAYATNYIGPGEAAVFMQYWLLNWGSSACPSGWSKYEDTDCVTNSDLQPAPDVPITDLAKLGLGATAAAGGNDSVTFSYGTDAYGITGKDKVLDISSVWNKAEFNVLGDAGGSRADFNSGSSIAVTLVVLDGSTAAPTCVAHGGTTGETNNLNLGKCSAFSGIPNIQFTESN
jgi:hypothetical protein